MTTYTIQFDYPEGTCWAGMHKGALGWAPTLATALLFDDADRAKATLDNAYGPSSEWGRVVQVGTAPRPR